MKKIILNIGACLLVLSGVSCRDKEKDTVVTPAAEDTTAMPAAPVETDTMTADTMAVLRQTDKTDVAIKEPKVRHMKLRSKSMSSSPSYTKPAPPAPKKDMTGYSAPDGSDAENHDGDMYTKHDTTKMPSGVPIK
jgi:hypothetical protein